MQKHVNLVDLVKSFPTNIHLQNLASIQKRTSPLKFAHLAEKSEKGSTSNLSTKQSTDMLPHLLEKQQRILELPSRGAHPAQASLLQRLALVHRVGELQEPDVVFPNIVDHRTRRIDL